MSEDPKQPETVSATDPLGGASGLNEPAVPDGELEAIADVVEAGAPIPEPLSSEAEAEQRIAEQQTLSQQAQAIEALQIELETLRQKLSGVSQHADSYKAQYVRIAADFDNFRKRTQKERGEIERQARRGTIAELLPVVDNFERARAQIKPADEGEMVIHKSYQGVYKNLVDSLKRLGVSAMRPEGQEFDPNYHEAMLRQPTDEYPEGTVMEQLVRGYLIDDQVLRHAMVKVAAPQEPVVASEENGESTENNTDRSEAED